MVPPQPLPGPGKRYSRRLKIIASDGLDPATGEDLGWEHVSVSLVNCNACPSWDEMCLVKNLFWENECVIQYHPPHTDYVNIHPGCLHLWRPRHSDIPMPPTYCV